MLAQDGAAKVQIHGVVVEQEDVDARRADNFETNRRRRFCFHGNLDAREGAPGHLAPCFWGDFFSGNSYLGESLRFSSLISSGRRWKTAEARSHLRLSMAG